LGLVAMKGSLDLVEMLIKREADINLQDKDGNTILMLAVMCGKVPVVEHLLEYEHINLKLQNSKGKNVVYTSIQYKRISTISKLIKRMDSSAMDILAVVDNEGFSPLYYASMRSLGNVVSMFSKRGLQLSEHEQSALKPKWFLACSEGDTKKIRCLQLAGFDSSVTNEDGCTGILVAAKAGLKEALMLLVRGCSTGSDEINTKDSEGYTALHWAVASGELASVEVLLEAGCEHSVPNGDGVTPISIAEIEGFQEIWELLRKKGAISADKMQRKSTFELF